MRLRSLFLLLIALINVSLAQRPGRPLPEPVGNPLLNTHWKTDGVPFESKDQHEYLLYSYDELSFDSQMGHFISFDEKTFTSHYSAPCGNDCFTSVSGEYWFKTDSLVHIKVLKIDRHGFCNKNSETLNRDFGFFNLQKLDRGWKLVQVN